MNIDDYRRALADGRLTEDQFAVCQSLVAAHPRAIRSDSAVMIELCTIGVAEETRPGSFLLTGRIPKIPQRSDRECC